MLVTAAVLWAVVGTSYFAQAIGGDVLTGLSGLVIALAALAASIASVIAALNGRHAKNNSAEAVRSLGPSNGITLRQMVEEIQTFEAYQHENNHKVVGILTELKGANGLLMKVIETLLDKLKEEG